MEDQFDQTENLEEITENLWQEVKPLYEQLHAYVRRKLYNYYKEKFPQDDVVSEFGAIPAHLLGNVKPLIFRAGPRDVVAGGH